MFTGTDDLVACVQEHQDSFNEHVLHHRAALHANVESRAADLVRRLGLDRTKAELDLFKSQQNEAYKLVHKSLQWYFTGQMVGEWGAGCGLRERVS